MKSCLQQSHPCHPTSKPYPYHLLSSMAEADHVFPQERTNTECFWFCLEGCCDGVYVAVAYLFRKQSAQKQNRHFLH